MNLLTRPVNRATLFILVLILLLQSSVNTHAEEVANGRVCYKLIDLAAPRIKLFCINDVGELCGQLINTPSGSAPIERPPMSDNIPIFCRNDRCQVISNQFGGALVQGIDERGRVVLATVDGAYFWSDGIFRKANTDGQFFVPRGVNRQGDITGLLIVPGSLGKGAICKDGRVSLLPPVVGFSTVGWAINSRDDIAGGSTESGGDHVILWKDYKAYDLGLALEEPASEARDINDKDEVIGECTSDGTGFGSGKGFTWSRQSGFSEIAPLSGYSETLPRGLNDRGVIVGTAKKSDGSSCGFVTRNGITVDLNTLTTNLNGARILAAYCINNSGTISVSVLRSGIWRAALLVPINKK